MKALRISFLALIISSIFFTSCEEPLCIRGEGPIVSEFLNINQTFSKVELEGSCDVIISYGNNYEIEAVGHGNIIDRLITSVVGDELIIELEKHCYLQHELTLYITMPYIDKATLDGSGDMIINDFPNQFDFQVDLIGSGDIQLNEFTGTENMYIKIDGSGDIKAHKDFPDLQVLDIRVSGSGDYSGYPIEVSECNVSISGSGSAKVYAEDVLNVIIDGSGDVFYKGNPQVTQSIAGSGDVINRN